MGFDPQFSEIEPFPHLLIRLAVDFLEVGPHFGIVEAMQLSDHLLGDSLIDGDGCSSIVKDGLAKADEEDDFVPILKEIGIGLSLPHRRLLVFHVALRFLYRHCKAKRNESLAGCNT